MTTIKIIIRRLLGVPVAQPTTIPTNAANDAAIRLYFATASRIK